VLFTYDIPSMVLITISEVTIMMTVTVRIMMCIVRKTLCTAMNGRTSHNPLHDIKRDRVDSDMRLFFRTSFSELTSRRSGLGNWPTEEQLDLLCEQAGGLFVYARATIRFIDVIARVALRYFCSTLLFR